MSVGRLEINSISLDLSGSEIVPLNFAIADAKDPQKRKRNTSEVITLPGTDKNKDFFFSAWSLGISDAKGDGIGFGFDPTIRYKARYIENNRTIFEGSAVLDSVNVLKDVYSFEVILYSDVVDVFQGLGDLKLGELDWSGYDHILSVANIEASWSAAVGSGYVYGHVDYGFTTDLFKYKTNELFPHVYVKEVYEKAFGLFGRTIDSTFMDTDRFKRIMIGTGGGDKILIPPTEIVQRRCNNSADGSISRTATVANIATVGFPTVPIYRASYTFNETVKISDNAVVTTASVNDPIPQFDPTTGRITVSNTGSYNLNVQATIPITFGFTGGTPTSTSPNWRVIFRIRRNGAIVFNQNQVYTDVIQSPASMVINYSGNYWTTATDVFEMEFLLQNTGVFAEAADPVDLPDTFDYTFDLNNAFTFDLTSIQAEIVDGDLVNISTYLPDIKVVDVLNGFIKKFNMYVGEPDDRGVIKIEPLSDFYKSTDEAKVMSHKVDYSKPIKIRAASNIEGKEYAFKFAEDLDYYKKLYFDQYGAHYGDFVYDVPSTFKKGQRVYQMPFAQSVPVQIAGSELIIPRIISYDPVNEITKPYKGKARIYYYQGLKTLPTTTWELVNSATSVGTVETVTPSFHHIDDLVSPTFDMNFGVPEIVYYTATAYTTNNSFTEFHDKFLRELTGRDSKFVEIYMHLNEDDLQGEFLREPWNIKGTIYRINKIAEYNGNTENRSTTLCELVRINEGTNPATYVMGPLHLPKSAPTDVFQFPDTIKKSGDGNDIGKTSKNVTVIGDDNIVDDGLKNVFVFGDNNHATQSNTIYINGSPAALTDHHSGYKIIAASTTVTISEDKQMINYGTLIVDGILNIQGDLILT